MQAISDRFELQDLVFRYAQIIDSKDFDLLREDVFTADALIDYSAFGGSKGNLEETIAYLHKAMKIFPNTQHLNANIQIQLGVDDPDTASGRVMCFNPQDMRLKEGGSHIFFCGAWYVDEYRRTEKSWRISRRVEEKSFLFNEPNFMKAPAQ